MRQRYGDTAGACAYVGDAKGGIVQRCCATGRGSYTVECDFNYVFGLGPRDQDIWRDFEVQAPEFLVAGEVLRRDAARAQCDCGEVPLALRRADFLLWMRVEPRIESRVSA